MKKVITIFFIIMTLFLTLMCERLADQKTNLQNNIDRMFANSYQYLILNMWNISEFEYDETYLKTLNIDNTKHGALVSALFQYTSYNENYELGNCIQILDQSSGSDAFLSLTIDKELYDKLKELNTNFQSVSLAENVHKMLETKISSQ